MLKMDSDLYMRMLFLEKEIEQLQEYILELEVKLKTNIRIQNGKTK